jgi:hypothetical protein
VEAADGAKKQLGRNPEQDEHRAENTAPENCRHGGVKEGESKVHTGTIRAAN